MLSRHKRTLSRVTTYDLPKSGLEHSRRVEREAALEEIRRVLRQDNAMYEARASASASMLKTMRTLEAGKRVTYRGVSFVPTHRKTGPSFWDEYCDLA